MAREDRLSYINLGRGLCNALTTSGRRCDQLCGRCPYHAEESRRCESCLDAQPERRCQLARVGYTRFCEYHTAFPDLGKILLEHLRAGVAPVQEEFLGAHFPTSAGEFRGNFQALVATLSAQMAAPALETAPALESAQVVSPGVQQESMQLAPPEAVTAPEAGGDPGGEPGGDLGGRPWGRPWRRHRRT